MASSDPFPALSHQAPTRILAVLPAMLEDAAFRSGWALAGISACLQKDGVPFLVIDPIDFDEKGHIKARKPSFTKQTIKISFFPAKADINMEKQQENTY